jgi:thioester reductase-like protein
LLAATDAQVHCLVRADNAELARTRLRQSFARAFPGEEPHAERIVVVRGDWNDALFAELEAFTGAKNGHDDIADTMSDLVDELDNHTQLPAPPPPRPLPAPHMDSQPLGI